jgi:hypothetical protein
MLEAVSRFIGPGLVASEIGGWLGYAVAGQLIPLAVAQLLGSPLGFSGSWTPIGGSPPNPSTWYQRHQVGTLNGKLHDAVHEFFDGPATEQHPSQPPAGQAAPAPG